MMDGHFLIPLGTTAVAVGISYTVVMSSLLFFILEKGGNKDQYGLILAMYSFASFCATPIYGALSDALGFRLLYLISFSISILGGFIYFAAETVWMIGLGRFLGGLGAASITLNFSYIARTAKTEERTRILAILSSCRIFGIVVGPALNILMSNIKQVNIFDSFYIDSLNAVGLLLICINALALILLYYFIEDPRNDYDAISDNVDATKGFNSRKFIGSLLSPDILVYMTVPFCFQSSVTFIETTMPLISHDALQWGPVEISMMLIWMSLVSAVNIVILFKLSAMGVKDESLLKYGLLLSSCSFVVMYFWWTNETTVFKLVFPLTVGACSIPFTSSPSRSLLTKAVDNKPHLARHQGLVQALTSMLVNFARSLTPVYASTYCLELTSSQEETEFTYYFFLYPLLISANLFGQVYLEFIKDHKRNSNTSNSNKYESFHVEAKPFLEAKINEATFNGNKKIYEYARYEAKEPNLEDVVENRTCKENPIFGNKKIEVVAQLKDIVLPEEVIAAAMEEALLNFVDESQKESSTLI